MDNKLSGFTRLQESVTTSATCYNDFVSLYFVTALCRIANEIKLIIKGQSV